MYQQFVNINIQNLINENLIFHPRLDNLVKREFITVKPCVVLNILTYPLQNS